VGFPPRLADVGAVSDAERERDAHKGGWEETGTGVCLMMTSKVVRLPWESVWNSVVELLDEEIIFGCCGLSRVGSRII
jgi:hypothetical protein